jgi:hypothetical protein
MLATIVALMLVVGTLAAVNANRTQLCKNLTLTECDLTVMDTRVVSGINGYNEKGFGRWETQEGDRPSVQLMVTIRVRLPAGDNRVLEIDNNDLVLVFQSADEKYSDRIRAGALHFEDKMPDLANPPLLAFPTEVREHFGIHKDNHDAVVYIVAGFAFTKNVSKAELYLGQPIQTITVNQPNSSSSDTKPSNSEPATGDSV